MTMLAIHLRTGWKAIAAWVLALGATMLGTTSSLSHTYPTQAKIDTYADAVGTGDALLFINGRVAGIDTLGGVIANEFGFLASFAVPLMGIALVARMTRREEDAGRLEILLSGRIGHGAPMASALVATATAMLLTTAALLVGLIAVNVDFEGAVLYSLSLGLLGFVFAGIAAVAAQLVEHTRGIFAIGLGTLAASYLLRGIGDVLENWITWLSPLGWAEKTSAYGDATWWPLLIPLAVGVVLATVAITLAGRRDLGSALIRPRAADPSASPFLRTPVGFAVRLHRGAVVGWTTAAVIVSAAFGALSQELLDALEGNESMADAFGGSASLDGVIALIVMILALICGGFVIQAIATVRSEETEGRLESVLSGRIGRTNWLLTQLAVVAAGMVIVAAAGWLAIALSTSWSTDQPGLWSHTLGAVTSYFPAIAILGALAVALYGLLPHGFAAAWLAFAFTAFVAYLGDPLNLPDAIVNAAPFNQTGYPPSDSATGLALLVMGLVAAALAVAGFVGFRRRGIPAK